MKRLASIKISMSLLAGRRRQRLSVPRSGAFRRHPGHGQLSGSGPHAGRASCRHGQAFSLIPGKHKVNLHSTYADTEESIDLDAIEPRHYASWVQWAKEHGLGLDFNPTCFSHEKAESGYTLSSADEGIRRFWIEHCRRSRRVGEYFGKELGQNASQTSGSRTAARCSGGPLRAAPAPEGIAR